MKGFIKHPVIHWNMDTVALYDNNLIEEEPLSIRIDGKPYSVVMRTPGDETAHAAGFCLSEGIVDSIQDIKTLACCDETDANVVTVTLSGLRRTRIADLLSRRGFISQASCGICGKEIVEDLHQMVTPLKDDIRIDANIVVKHLNDLSQHQPLRKHTRASHAAAIFSSTYKLLSVAEDVGRHNALDKAIGKLFLINDLGRAAFLLLSSRVSYELVQKTARAGIPVIVAVSRPTALAVQLSKKLNITLACLAQASGLAIFCNEYRLKR